MNKILNTMKCWKIQQLLINEIIQHNHSLDIKIGTSILFFLGGGEGNKGFSNLFNKGYILVCNTTDISPNGKDRMISRLTTFFPNYRAFPVGEIYSGSCAFSVNQLLTHAFILLLESVNNMIECYTYDNLNKVQNHACILNFYMNK